MEAYIADCLLTQAGSTVRQKAQTLETFLDFAGPGAGLDALTKGTLRNWYADLATGGLHGATRSLDTRRKMVQRVEHAWKWAANEEEFDGHVPPPKTLGRLPRDPRTPTVAPTWAEMDACIAATLDEMSGAGNGYRKASQNLYQLAVVLRFTGLRVQQAMGLRWDDFDLGRRRLTIRGELGKTEQEQTGRIIPISEHLARELAGWGRREGWVVQSNRRGKHAREARQRDMVRCWKRSGVRPEAWKQSHHSFRKGFITGLRKLGADSDAVEFYVGHSLDIRGDYTDPDGLALREAVALIPPVGEVVSLDAARSAAPQEPHKRGAARGESQ